MEEEYNLERFFDLNLSMLCVATIDGIFLKVNKLWAETLGYQEEEMVGHNASEFIHPDDWDATVAAVNELNENNQLFRFVNRYRGKNGAYRSFEWRIQVYGERLYAAALDITDMQKAESEREQQSGLIMSLLDSIPEIVFYKDINLRYLGCNPACAKFLGKTKKEIIGKMDSDLFDKPTSDYIKKCDREVIQLRRSFQIEQWLTSSEGEKILLDTMKTPYLDEKGDIIGIVGIGRDITEKKQRENEIQFLSFHDQLTGLYNRRFYEEELKRFDKNRNIPLAIIMGDVNDLKFMNDSFGHRAGDQMIQKVALAMQKGCREDDVVARIGGDEFAVILPRTSLSVAQQIIERIESLLSDERVGMLNITASFGSASKGEKGQSIYDIIKIAENRMYFRKMNMKAEMQGKAIDIIVSSFFNKNNKEQEHSKRVGDICKAIAHEMKFNSEEIYNIKLAGIMHDIGKVDIDTEILNKKDPLISSDWDQIKTHPEIGYRMLNTDRDFFDIAPFVKQHHERWDGSGYPDGLKGDEILMEARIISIAEAYDNMMNNEKHALNWVEAGEEIRRCAGTQFDPDLVKLFLENVLAEGNRQSIIQLYR